MKNKITLALALATCIGLSSCTITYHSVTNNPVGTKKGVSKGWVFSSDLDYSFKKAAEKGNIQKIGTTEFKLTYFGPFVKVKTMVTGE